MSFNPNYPPEARLETIIYTLDNPGAIPEYELGGMLIGLSEAVVRGADVTTLPSYREFERRLQQHAAKIKQVGGEDLRYWDDYCFEPGRAIYRDKNKHWWFWVLK